MCQYPQSTMPIRQGTGNSQPNGTYYPSQFGPPPSHQYQYYTDPPPPLGHVVPQPNHHPQVHPGQPGYNNLPPNVEPILPRGSSLEHLGKAVNDPPPPPAPGYTAYWSGPYVVWVHESAVPQYVKDRNAGLGAQVNGHQASAPTPQYTNQNHDPLPPGAIGQRVHTQNHHAVEDTLAARAPVPVPSESVKAWDERGTLPNPPTRASNLSARSLTIPDSVPNPAKRARSTPASVPTAPTNVPNAPASSPNLPSIPADTNPSPVLGPSDPPSSDDQSPVNQFPWASPEDIAFVSTSGPWGPCPNSRFWPIWRRYTAEIRDSDRTQSTVQSIPNGNFSNNSVTSVPGASPATVNNSRTEACPLIYDHDEYKLWMMKKHTYIREVPVQEPHGKIVQGVTIPTLPESPLFKSFDECFTYLQNFFQSHGAAVSVSEYSKDEKTRVSRQFIYLDCVCGPGGDPQALGLQESVEIKTDCPVRLCCYKNWVVGNKWRFKLLNDKPHNHKGMESVIIKQREVKAQEDDESKKRQYDDIS